MFPTIFFASGQQKQFDIVSYTLPKGFTEEQSTERVTVTKDGGANGFCIISIFKSIDAGNDSKKNFDMSWEELVKKFIPVSKPAMQPPVADDGWKTEIGSAVFEKEGIKGTVVLLSSTKSKKLVNIQVLLNGDEYIKEMSTFLESVTMKDTAVYTKEQSSTTALDDIKVLNERKAVDEIKTGPKADVWVYLKSSATVSLIGNRTVDGSFNPNYYIVYPNGDYYPRFPLNGLHQLDNNNKKDESWGKFTMKGSKGLFQSKYDKIQVEKISATLMKRTGYTFQLRKMASVDGLLLEGEWGPYPDWEKQAHLSKDGYQGTGVRNVIAFKKDGSFIDFGFFVTNLTMPSEVAERAPGKGTYAIKNFTILLKYDDGRMVYKAFTGAGSINPATDDKAIYINENSYYKAGFNKSK